MRDAGMTARIDAIGNVVGSLMALAALFGVLYVLVPAVPARAPCVAPFRAVRCLPLRVGSAVPPRTACAALLRGRTARPGIEGVVEPAHFGQFFLGRPAADAAPMFAHQIV